MTLQFQLTHDDFLTYHLYSDTTSTLIQRQKKKITYALSGTYIVLGILMLFFLNTFSYMGYIFIGVGVLWFLLYPSLFRYKRKRFYVRYVRETYVNRIDKMVTLTFGAEAICSKVSGMESIIQRSELTTYVELSSYFLIGLKAGTFFIIPKHAISDTTAFLTQMQDYKLERTNALDWKW